LVGAPTRESVVLSRSSRPSRQGANHRYAALFPPKKMGPPTKATPALRGSQEAGASAEAGRRGATQKPAHAPHRPTAAATYCSFIRHGRRPPPGLAGTLGPRGNARCSGKRVVSVQFQCVTSRQPALPALKGMTFQRGNRMRFHQFDARRLPALWTGNRRGREGRRRLHKVGHAICSPFQKWDRSNLSRR
jgi:hypothetical protein